MNDRKGTAGWEAFLTRHAALIAAVFAVLAVWSVAIGYAYGAALGGAAAGMWFMLALHHRRP